MRLFKLFKSKAKTTEGRMTQTQTSKMNQIVSQTDQIEGNSKPSSKPSPKPKSQHKEHNPPPESISEETPDINMYQQKKTLAQGMLDIALLSANASQLKYVLENKNHPYYLIEMVLISTSIALQIAVGIGLIWNVKYNITDIKELHTANQVNNFTIMGVFFVTVINVFISMFCTASDSYVIK